MVSFPDVSFTVDIVPVILILAGLLSAVSVAMMSATRNDRDDVFFWALGGLGVAVGVLLIVLRGRIPDFVSIPIGNGILILGHCALSMGTSRHVGRGVAIDVALGVALSLIFVAVYLAGAGMEERVVIYVISLAVFAVRIVRNFLAAPRGFSPALAIAAMSTMLLAETGRLISFYWPDLALLNWQAMNRLNAALGVPIALGIGIAVVTLARPISRVSANQEADKEQGVDGPAPWRLARNRCAIIAPNGQELPLTGNEYIVLQHLGDAADLVDRPTLNALIGRSTDNPKDRGIDFLLSRLRRKCLAAGVDLPVVSVRGRGYLLKARLQQV